jgi:hypothetical protein
MTAEDLLVSLTYWLIGLTTPISLGTLGVLYFTWLLWKSDQQKSQEIKSLETHISTLSSQVVRLSAIMKDHSDKFLYKSMDSRKKHISYSTPMDSDGINSRGYNESNAWEYH